jgi:DNA-binding response OmpR family regulator
MRLATILVVEDDPVQRELISDLFTEEGYRVLTASNGREALDIVRDPGRTPSLVLLDLMMPIMSGWDFLEHVKIDRSVKEVPTVIIVSAFVSTATKRLETCGVARHLRFQKPFNPDHVVALVRTYSWRDPTAN